MYKITLLLLLALLTQCNSKKTQVDLVLSGGNVYDGIAEDATVKDIVIQGDSIIAITSDWQEKYSCGNVINLQGYTVSPGFIDPHTHAFDDLSSTTNNANLNFLKQGVTTVITGNDGGGPVKVAETFAKWQDQGIGINAGLLVGHGTVRKLAMGLRDEKPTEEALNTMKMFVKQAMEEGALGLSSGLYYSPGSFAQTEEVIELAKVASAYNGIYDTHMRDESSYNIGLKAAVEEAVEIAVKGNIPLQISHIKCLGTDVWNTSSDLINYIDSCRNAGVNITANQYPYNASGTNVISAIFPRWSQAGGPDAFLQRIHDPAQRPKIYKEITENIRKRGGASSLLITRYKDASLVKHNLQEVADIWQLTPEEAAFRIAENGNARLASFNMIEEDITNFMKQDWVVTGSDGSTGHPRKFGTFPRKMQKYIMDEKVMSMGEFINKSSAKTAKIFGITDRGKLAKGYKADIIVFKPEEVAEKATFQEPELYAEGIQYLIINGKIAIKEGEYTGILAGETIKKQVALVN
ncbi:N-acyl-D-amino-acid deacylase family protein [Chondrinema litorale]|uniref:N-acyl-D-amino-acid deacylase family protein n=1 Tax=Chondrinema litorale TaxID=2994555 RepID=UPI002543F103|nr:amidohydrolase family protein [Chondrinema litorale]UZR94578.1 amidohydrolase family protein [Chondrinema litorale]